MTAIQESATIGRVSSARAAEVQEAYDLLVAAAKKDWAEAKAARAKGKPIPATPSLDELHRRYEEKMTTKGKSTTKKAGGSRSSDAVSFWVRRGEGPWSSVPKRLSTIAYFYTEGIKTGHDRVKPAELRDILTKGGADFAKPGWTVTLANGVVVEAHAVGAPRPANVSGTAAVAAKVKTAPKKAVAKKAPAKKAAAKKVTPIPKKKEATKRTPRAVKNGSTSNEIADAEIVSDEAATA